MTKELPKPEAVAFRILGKIEAQTVAAGAALEVLGCPASRLTAPWHSFSTHEQNLVIDELRMRGAANAMIRLKKYRGVEPAVLYDLGLLAGTVDVEGDEEFGSAFAHAADYLLTKGEDAAWEGDSELRQRQVLTAIAQYPCAHSILDKAPHA